MNNLGVITLICSLAFSIFSLANSIYGYIKKNQRAIEIGRLSLMSNTLVIFLSFTILATQLWRMDLSNYYVVMNSSEHLHLFYRITSIWAGSSGSLLFWNLLLSVFTFALLYKTKLDSEKLSLVNISLGVLIAFFTYLAVFYSDAQPFREFQPKAIVGRGLNPLLQHWAMIIHPPILYIGYVAFAIPFALAMATLITRDISPTLILSIRKWTLFSWFFLGCGILLGSKWAYEELGWGGYWAWDPVENASLMPWLLSSAFIHSVIIQERRGMLKFWNMFLIILTFHFTLLGTWITRSGVLEGPHSFSKSTIGTPFILFIFISFLIYLAILIYRKKDLEPDRELEAITSKEGSFFINNFLMVMATLVILLGVFSPLIYGKEFRAPWFNSWGVPTGIILLLLMGVSPLLAWRKAADTVFFQTLIKPIGFGVLVGVLYSVLYSKVFVKTDSSIDDKLSEIYAVLTISLAAFTLGGIAQEYNRGIKARLDRFKDESYLVSGYRMLFKNKRRYGGYLVHMSIVVLFIGFAGNAFKINLSTRFFYDLATPKGDEIVYTSQDKFILGSYEIAATSLKLKPIINGDSHHENSIYNVLISEEAIYKIRLNLSNVQTLVTERRFYPQISHLTGSFEAHIPTSEPSIYSTAKEDFYIQLGAIEKADLSDENPDLPMMYMQYYFGTNSLDEKKKFAEKFPTQVVANLEIWINPLVKFIWYGSLLYFLAGLFILLPTKENKS